MKKKIIEWMARAGREVTEDQIVFVDRAPAPIDEDVERDLGHSCQDAYWHFLPEQPWHFDSAYIWPEAEHRCQGPTLRRYHVMYPVPSYRPAGGELPQQVIDAFNGPSGLTPQEIWDLTPEKARERIKESWLFANSAAPHVLDGTLNEEWLPEGSRSHCSSIWLNTSLPLAYERGVNPLPFLRRLCSKPEWHFSRTLVKPADKGFYPSYGDGEIISVWPVKGGWVYAQAPKGSAQDNSWF